MSTLVVETGLSVVRLLVRSLDVASKEITWELGNGTDDPLDYTFQILRSESPEGPFEAVSPLFSDQYIFVDRRIPLGDRYTALWYKLVSTRKRDGRVTETAPVTQEAEADLIAVAIRRLEMTYFIQVVGRACWLFKKRVFGPRCRTCWDPVLGGRTNDRCLDCFNTGILRGYHNPIEIFVQIDPATKSVQNNAQQVTQLVTCGARTSFYPNIAPGDVLVEAENKRWRVQELSLSEQRRTPIKQEMTLKQIDERDIEFKLPIKLDRALRDIQPSPPRLYSNATDLDTAIENRTPDAFGAFMRLPGEDDG